MSSFFKLGLPWVVTVSVAFYLGLRLGSDSNPEANKFSPEINSGITNHSLEITGKIVDKTKSSESVVNQTISNSPPLELPPNLKRIMEGGDIIERLGAYLDAVRAMDRGNVANVVRAFEALPKGYGRHLEMKLLMRSWSTIDPQSALNYANEVLDPKSERRFAISEILAGWVNHSPDDAINWAKTNSQQDNGYGNSLMFGIVKGLSEKSLDRANEVFQKLPEGNAKWQASTFLAQQYSELGVDQAISWADQFPKDDPRMRATILGQIGAKLARQDIEATAKWVESLEDDKASYLVMDNLLTQWVPEDPIKASEWVNNIEETEKKFHGIKQLASRWSLTDPVAAAKWLNTFPPSTQMDPVVNEFVNNISARDPEGAAGWAISIIDTATREKALKKALDAWNRIDPKTASEWQKINLPN